MGGVSTGALGIAIILVKARHIGELTLYRACGNPLFGKMKIIWCLKSNQINDAKLCRYAKRSRSHPKSYFRKFQEQ